jgi:hypothetical protein
VRPKRPELNVGKNRSGNSISSYDDVRYFGSMLEVCQRRLNGCRDILPNECIGSEKLSSKRRPKFSSNESTHHPSKQNLLHPIDDVINSRIDLWSAGGG